jgi:hypothetical protein
MPTTYRSRGNAIEKIGPHEGGLSGRGTVIAFCSDDRTAALLVHALDILKGIEDDFANVALAPNATKLLSQLGML